MRPNSLIDHAAQLLRAVLKFDAAADATTASYFRQHRSLGPRERHALAETIYVVLRQRLRLQHLARDGAGPIERRLAIVAWCGDERLLQAVLSQTERQWLAQVRAIDGNTLPDEARHNLPAWLVEALRASGDEAWFWSLAQALLQPAPLDLRVNTLKARRDEVLRSLADGGIVARVTPYSPWGLRLEGQPAVNRLELYRRGAFEVQDEGSQLLALLVEARRGEMVVDFCAGAGGKTLALGAAMRNTGRLYAFDLSGHRLDAMRPRLERAGLANVHTLQLAHERDDRLQRLAAKADRVLVDAPCSGLGTLRRNPDLKWRQSESAIEALRERQVAILDSAAALVKPGGRLVYGTCSLLPIENESVAHTFNQTHPDYRRLDAAEVLFRGHVAEAALLSTDGHLRLWPHRHETDGFFAAIWQRDR